MSKTLRSQHIYDIAIIGAGAAGCLAAIRASAYTPNIILIDTNDAIGKKILMTGNRRCNLTNTDPVDEFIKKFGPTGRFLRPAFFSFPSQRTRDFFEANGLKLKVEASGRVFPFTDKSRSVVDVLAQILAQKNIACAFRSRVSSLQLSSGTFRISIEGSLAIEAKKVIIATGGCSYAQTGSVGGGLQFAKDLGHAIVPVSAALVPLRTKEAWVKDLQGVSLKGVRLTWITEDHTRSAGPGEMLFTHFGISGPLVLDASRAIARALTTAEEVRIFLDFAPHLTTHDLEAQLRAMAAQKGKRTIGEFVQTYLPRNATKIFIQQASIVNQKPLNQITKDERRVLMNTIKKLPLTVNGCLPLENAMVSEGGVACQHIHSQTLESKIIPGLYFAGEVIEGRGPSGGYNLQQAFSTGFLAGESAGKTFKLMQNPV